jgi:prophage regulatory protein
LAIIVPVSDFFTQEQPNMLQLPEIGYLRLPQIIGNPKKNIPALIPVSRSAWWLGVKNGRYPKGVHLGPRTTAWPVESIRALIASTK